MSEPIYFWRYTLKTAQALNARTERSEFEGALIKIGEGHGCIHPWPELGDEPLEVQLKTLAEGDETLLIRGALESVELDASMRQSGVTLPPEQIPESHWLVRPGDDPDFARSDGFSIAKIKGTGDLAATRSEMNRWREAGLKIRLDFNECLASGEFLKFWNELSDEEISQIEFVEDPESYSYEGWWELRRAGIPLAVDREAGERLCPGDVLVMKPARPDWGMNAETPLVVTTYMDHAVGQMFAALKAASTHRGQTTPRRLVCGLLTHRCFEDDPFFEQITTIGPRLVPAEGTGLGFDDLLETLPWKRLN